MFTKIKPCSNKTFTLAEVLITLGIIGVVAALTLPAIVSTTKNKELETGLKKGYSTLAQALKMYEQENGYPVTSSIMRQELKGILMKYLNTAKALSEQDYFKRLPK